MSKKFSDRILEMNYMYNLPVNKIPCIDDATESRLRGFKKTLVDEVNEIDEIILMVEAGADSVDVAVAIADLLGDIIVYCRSEALKYGLPLEEVLDIIMDSNQSKLGKDGKPIYDENGKFLKGPNYWKPEAKIKELILNLSKKSTE